MHQDVTLLLTAFRVRNMLSFPSIFFNYLMSLVYHRLHIITSLYTYTATTMQYTAAAHIRYYIKAAQVSSLFFSRRPGIQHLHSH